MKHVASAGAAYASVGVQAGGALEVDVGSSDGLVGRSVDVEVVGSEVMDGLSVVEVDVGSSALLDSEVDVGAAVSDVLPSSAEDEVEGSTAEDEDKDRTWSPHRPYPAWQLATAQ